MRGKDLGELCDRHKPGITPAYAGKRLVERTTCGFPADHPRLCGEKFWAAVMPSMLEGSPPPMRGKVTGVF